MIPSSDMDPIELLQTIPLFESLERDDLNALAGRLREVSVEAGQTVVARGDEGGALYGTQTVLVAPLFKQQYFGELSLPDGGPRSTPAVASRPTQLLALDREAFIEFI